MLLGRRSVLAGLLLAPATGAMAAEAQMTVRRFDFTAKPREGFTPVAADRLYDAASGYGFEPGEGRSFSVAAPEGDWRVSLAIGLIEPLVQTVFFTVHDRIWTRLEARKAARAASA